MRAIDTITRLALPGVEPAAEARAIEREEIEDLRGVKPLAGAVAFLAALPGHRWTIVTSAPRELAWRASAKPGYPFRTGW